MSHEKFINSSYYSLHTGHLHLDLDTYYMCSILERFHSIVSHARVRVSVHHKYSRVHFVVIALHLCHPMRSYRSRTPKERMSDMGHICVSHSSAFNGRLRLTVKILA